MRDILYKAFLAFFSNLDASAQDNFLHYFLNSSFHSLVHLGNYHQMDLSSSWAILSVVYLSKYSKLFFVLCRGFAHFSSRMLASSSSYSDTHIFNFKDSFLYVYVILGYPFIFMKEQSDCNCRIEDSPNPCQPPELVWVYIYPTGLLQWENGAVDCERDWRHVDK